MIIGIGGWERCLKTGMAAILAAHPDEFNIPGFQDYNIKRGFGNLHLYNLPYPWHYQTSGKLVQTIKASADHHLTDTLFIIDEADQVYNPRNYTSKEQTANLKGIGQHAKLGNVYIYTYQLGKPEDVLLGVDKILRSNTRIEFEMRYYDIETQVVLFRIINRLLPDIEPYDSYLTNVDKYYKYWNHKEPVI